MGKSTINLDDKLYDYMLSVTLRDSPLHHALREETNQLEMGVMQISADQGQFMALLVKMLGAKNIIEIGTFTGYSALLMAEALPDDGQLIACDVSEEWTNIGKRYWKSAKVSDKIHLKLAPATETLQGLIDEGKSETFDFAFIDADKENQQNYFELLLKLIRPGGVISIDNIFWGGSVIDDANQEESTKAIRKFNSDLHQDMRVEISMIPIGDGLTLARKV
ncbi:MAG: class I SAM-dependent methyltransferase [Gammaproteobacteria bacterium]|nr:class I SAM-dependent methyltransferase [Gammaproteobacteria bacterium]MDH5693418.1 class I SAM-dependent methyltransferase [Gammaproteobacteria bacterium]